MKKLVCLAFFSLLSIIAFAQSRCETCNGSGGMVCRYCSGYGVVVTTVWNPYMGCYQNVQTVCGACQGYKRVVCNTCGGRGTVSSPSFGGQTSWFVKTTYKCSICKSGNGCSGYWGIYHTNGTYEGTCKNSDGWGHTCGHSPEKHGLKSW